MNWDQFIEYLDEKECKLFDETDWSYPIYRCHGNGRMCGLDLNEELDEFMICAICREFLIDPPEGIINSRLQEMVIDLKKPGLIGVPRAPLN